MWRKQSHTRAAFYAFLPRSFIKRRRGRESLSFSFLLSHFHPPLLLTWEGLNGGRMKAHLCHNEYLRLNDVDMQAVDMRIDVVNFNFCRLMKLLYSNLSFTFEISFVCRRFCRQSSIEAEKKKVHWNFMKTAKLAEMVDELFLKKWKFHIFPLNNEFEVEAQIINFCVGFVRLCWSEKLFNLFLFLSRNRD